MLQSFIPTDFWDLGHKLFRSTPEVFPVTFIAGDALDARHLEVLPPFTTTNPPPAAPAALNVLTSLNPLRGHISAIHASSIFHLFDEESQHHLARALGALLSPEPGSMILGSHTGLPDIGTHSWFGDDRYRMFCHSPDSWTELWDGGVFEKGTVRVEATVKEVKKEYIESATGVPVNTANIRAYWLVWSVTRL